MNKKIRIGAVSYLNTKPLLLGFDKNEWNIIEEYPSILAQKLLNDEIDIGLVPVAVIPLLKEYYIISDFCIGAEGLVDSVGIFSEVPMDQIETVVLDYQSKTSVNLAKVLLKYYWKKEVVFEDAREDFIDHIKGTKAAVLIGDRALKQLSNTPYYYDLSKAWNDFTGLPFVFAAWIANKPIDPDFIAAFNSATGYGIDNLETVLQQNTFDHYDLKKYYTQRISYTLTDDKRKGLELFLSYLDKLS